MKIDYSKTFIKYFLNSYFKGFCFNMTFKKKGYLDIYLHSNILQHLFGSNLIFSTFKWNILEIF
jgi:hypothetical protein